MTPDDNDITWLLAWICFRVIQLGRDEVGDFTDSVVKLPTSVIFTRSNKVGDVGMVIHSFSFSFSQNSWTWVVFDRTHGSEDKKIKAKMFWLLMYTKRDNKWVEVMVLILAPNHVSLFFSKYVIVNFHHFLIKDAPKCDNFKTKKSWDTTPLKKAKNGKKSFFC